MLKVLCIFVDESHRLPLTLNHFYCMVEETSFRHLCYLYNVEGTHYYGLYERKHFMTMDELAEWREQQMKKLLDD